MPDQNQAALFSVESGVARIILNRPERLNAFNAAMHEALRAALDQCERDLSIRALTITGAGRAFSAGQDLSERAGMLAEGEVDLCASLENNYNPLVRRLAALPYPVIAAVNGVAAGAGASLALNCDVVLAGRGATFEFSFAKVALGPDSGASWLLPRLAGPARALGLALTSERIDASEAERIGLVFKVLDDAALSGEADRFAKMFAQRSPVALAAVKRRVREAMGLSFDEALDAERNAQKTLGHHPDYRAAVTAFMAKTNPTFQERK